MTNTGTNTRTVAATNKRKNIINKNKAKDIDVVMPMYDLIKYSANYSKNLYVYGNTIEINHY